MIEQVFEIVAIVSNVFEVYQDFGAVFWYLVYRGTEREDSHGGTDHDHEVTAAVFVQGLGVILFGPELSVANEVPTRVERVWHLFTEEDNVWLDGTMTMLF